MKIEDINPIESCSVRAKHRSELYDLVELPCLEACLSLYDKNIFTYWSNANKINNKDAEIGILYTSLDEKNKHYAQKLIQTETAYPEQGTWGLHQGEQGIIVHFPIEKNATSEEISHKMLTLTEGFVTQDVLIGRYPLEDAQDLALKIFGISLDSARAIEYLEALGFFCDPEEKLIWDSEELAQKHRAYVTDLSSNFQTEDKHI